MKICKSCNENKQLSEYYYKQDRDKHDSVCKKCRIAGKTISKSTTHKICKHCGIEKPFSEYQKAGGGKWLQPYCKPCDSERKRKYVEINKEVVKLKKNKYYQDNKESIIERQKEYINNNKEIVKIRQKKYREKNIDKKRAIDKEYQIKNRDRLINYCKERYAKNKETFKKKNKEYRENRTAEQIAAKKEYDRQYKIQNKHRLKEWVENNRDKIRERARLYNRKKAATDIKFRLLKNLRSRVHVALKRGVRSENTKTLLGCSVDYFKDYFQSLFTEGMTWDKYMNGEIVIDHIKPCISFDLTNIEEQRKCFHYTNLQPLWEVDNLKKGAKII